MSILCWDHKYGGVMKRKTLYVILGVIIVAAAIGAVVWRSRQAEQPEETARSAIVERGTMLVAISASGSIEPKARVNLAFESLGRVAEVAVEVGDRVEAGDVLARLDTRQLELQVEQARAALALAEAQLAQLQAGPRQEDVERAEASLRAAQAQVSAAAANRDQLVDGPSDAQIAAAEAQVAAAMVQREVAQDKYDAIKKDGTERENANYELYVAKEAEKAAQAALDELLAGANADELRAAQANVLAATAQQDAAQAQLDLLLAGPTEEDLADVEAQVEQARIALELAELSLRRAALYAPFDGIVSAVNVTAGEMTPTGWPPIVLLDASGFHITVSVDEMDVARLSEGQIVKVTLDAFLDAVIAGTVESIAPIATLDGGVVNYDVVIGLDSTDVLIRADMTANATILVEELADVLRLPTWVVRVDQDTGQTYVHRQVGDDVERVDVRLGMRYEGIVQVLDGLSEGDKAVWVVEETTPFD
jgi:HlyD family secretion protein